jgi:hypothetical protein
MDKEPRESGVLPNSTQTPAGALLARRAEAIVGRLRASRRRRCLPAFLAIQLALLVFGLDLLPAWTDEYSTLETAPRSLSENCRVGPR